MLSSVASLFPRNLQWVEVDNGGGDSSVRHSLIPLLISSIFLYFHVFFPTSQSHSSACLPVFFLPGFHTIWPSRHSNSRGPKRQKMTMHFSLSRSVSLFAPSPVFSRASTSLWCQPGVCFEGVACFSSRGGGRVVWRMKQPRLIRRVFSAGLGWADCCDHHSGVYLPTGPVRVFLAAEVHSVHQH